MLDLEGTGTHDQPGGTVSYRRRDELQLGPVHLDDRKGRPRDRVPEPWLMYKPLDSLDGTHVEPFAIFPLVRATLDVDGFSGGDDG